MEPQARIRNDDMIAAQVAVQDQTTKHESDGEELGEERITWPFPPPMQFPPVIQANIKDDVPRVAAGQQATIPIDVAGFLEQQQSSSPDLNDNRLDVIPVRSWFAPALIVAGLIATLIGIGAVVRNSLVGSSSIAPVEHATPSAPHPNASDSTAASGASAASAKPSTATLSRDETPDASGSNPASAITRVPTRHAVISGGPRTIARRSAARAGKSNWQRPMEPEPGIAVDQIYVNGCGELVDAHGHPIR